MKACVLKQPSPVETSPLVYGDAPNPQPVGNEVLIRVRSCGICRTDLHVVEGELPERKSHIIPGHQVVGTIEALGERSTLFPLRRTRWDTVAAPHMWHLQILFSGG